MCYYQVVLQNINFKKLFVSLFFPFLAGFIGLVFTFPSIFTWYASLNKPSFSLPNFVFGPVWTTLYFLMGVSFYLVLENKDGQKKKEAIYIFAFQLALNSLWSIAFFGLKNPLLSSFIIIALWFAIVLMIVKFYRINKVAGFLNLPYLFWVSFASVLNFAIYALNL